MLRQASIIIGVIVLNLVNAQSILKILSQQNNVSYFTDFLQQNQDIIQLLDDGSLHTVLVPTDAAFMTAQSLMPTSFTDNGWIRALLQYHILLDTHPSDSFLNSSQLVPTLLQNASYTNVTGGQRVELLMKNGPTFFSAIKTESKIVQPDVFYRGGLLHIIDSVLQIPLSFPATITKAGLPHLVALLNLGNWLTPDSVAYKLALHSPDLSFVGPDNPDYGNGYTGWNGLTQEELDEIFLYHVMPGLVYSTDIINNTRYLTKANISLVARQFTAGIQVADFLDQSQITTTNYLTANGVLHIVDKPLDPKQAGSAPNMTDVDKALNIVEETPKKPWLTTAMIAGIVAGSVAILFAVSAGIILLVRKSKRDKLNKRHSRLYDDFSKSVNGFHAVTYPNHQTPVELFSTAKQRSELHGKESYYKVYEMSASHQIPPHRRSDRVVQSSTTNSENGLLPETPLSSVSGSSRSTPRDFI